MKMKILFYTPADPDLVLFMLLATFAFAKSMRNLVIFIK